MALAQVSLAVLHFSPVSIVPPMLHTHFDHLHACLTSQIDGRGPGTFQISMLFWERGAVDTKADTKILSIFKGLI